MSMDSKKYPRCAAYIERLPHGLQSHPECTISGEALNVQDHLFPRMRELTDLPTQLVKIILPANRETWIPEAHAVALAHATRDAFFSTDAEYYKLVEKLNEELFNRPVFRALFRILSPQLLVMGAARRWGAIHRGTTLEVDATPTDGAGRRKIRGSFTFPTRLWDQMAIDRYSRGCLVAVRLAGGRNVVMSQESITETGASFILGWDS